MEPEDHAFTKRARVSGVTVGSSAGGPDRLSSLPDCLLHTIMSFLKARQAVQTCVLSTRWTHLWRSVPCLDIDFDEFNIKVPPVAKTTTSVSSNHNRNYISSSEDSSSSDSDTSDSDSDSGHVDPDTLTRILEHGAWQKFNKYKDWEVFEDFAVTLMRCCNIAQLDSFRLHVDRSRAPEFGNRLAAGWLRRAMKYGTPDLELGLSSGSWRLKKLQLCHVLLDNNFLNRVSSVCRSLEDLELDDCSCRFQSITSNSLKTLVLKHCEWRNLSEIMSPTLKTLVIDGNSNTGDCVLVILAPCVAYLHLNLNTYVNDTMMGVSLNEVPSVAKASIHLWGHKFSYAQSKLAGDQFNLLRSISNVTNLELSGLVTMVRGKEPRFQEFKNLRNLLLNDCDLSDDFKTLVFFLRSSPILENLTLRCCEFPKDSNKKKGASTLRGRAMLCLRGGRTLRIGPPRRGGLTLTTRQPSQRPLPILNETSSSELCGLDLPCENLKVEIIYKYGDGPYFLRLMQRVSVNLSKNNIKLTKVD